jgi:hypothetical protein
MVAAPVPDPVPAMVIHATLLVAVHAHPLEVVSVIVPVSPAPTAVREVGVMEYVQAAAAWLTWNVCPAMVTVPLRALVAVFAPTLSVTAPFPFPLAPPVTVTHATLLTEVHAHPVGAVTVRFADPAVAGTEALVAESANVHAAPDWLTVIVCPAMLIVPEREMPDVFGATVKFAEPSPDIEPPLVIVIQLTALPAVHAQLDPVVTAMLPLVPVAGAFTADGDTL